ICVKRARLTDRHGRKKWETWVYAYWGMTPQAGGLGQADLPQAVRDRDQLPADEPVPDSDDDQAVQRAVPLHNDRAAAAEPVGVVASRGPVEPAAGLPAVHMGAPGREVGGSRRRGS